MKKGWQTKSLGEVAEVYDGPHATPKTVGTGPIFLGISALRDGVIDLNETRHVTEEDFRQWTRRVKPQPNDVVFSYETRLGQAAIIPDGLECCLGRRMGLVRFDEDQVVPRFFLYQYLSPPFRDYLDSKTVRGATVDRISIREFPSFQIVVPPIPEQQRIVGILDEAFEGLARATTNVEQSLHNARALFESHLQSVFTLRGEGWQQKTLEEIAITFGRGKSKHRPRNAPHLYGGKYPFVQTGDIRNAGHVITEYTQTYSEAGLAQSKLWPKGTICITIAANIAETAILGFDACFPDSVIGVVANPNEADIGFIEYLLQSVKVRIQAMGKGSAQANINMGTFENERFPFPPISEQKRIVAKLDSLHEETQRLQSIYRQKLAALGELKKSLLHEAFTGKL